MDGIVSQWYEIVYVYVHVYEKVLMIQQSRKLIHVSKSWLKELRSLYASPLPILLSIQSTWAYTNGDSSLSQQLILAMRS